MDSALKETALLSPNLIRAVKTELGLRRLVGGCPGFLAEVEKIPLVARCDAGVLITGETGTGKEMFARAVHYLGPRAGFPFVPLNCGAIPADLVENELFGHVRGAFTGAVGMQHGLVAEAEGGTLFLDEVGCLPLSAQVKLLRLLQEREYKPLGCSKTRSANVRIIAATNAEPDRAVQEGTLRRDLYYRLDVIRFALPPLRARTADVPLLARHFLEHYLAEHQRELDDFTPEAMAKLLRYDWPGNVRELENVVERAVIFAKGNRIEDRDLSLPDAGPAPGCGSFQAAKARAVEQFERDYIRQMLLAHDGNISRAAKASDKNRRAFWELMRKHRIGMRNGPISPDSP